MFLVREDQYERFNCLKPTIPEKAQSYIDWIEPMKEMMHTADGCKETNPSMDLFFVSFRSAVHLHYTFFGGYEGGEFCQGVNFTKETSNVFWKVLQTFDHKTSDPIPHAKEHELYKGKLSMHPPRNN